jgi:tRNA A-37 threonylcarbamoyl transferase component Bud32/tetratricopeptide (TPR) repeat protein/TolB-like protein
MGTASRLCTSCDTPVPDDAAFCPNCGEATPTGVIDDEQIDQQRLSAALKERYRIQQELGRGGMAVVYLAQDVKHDRQVAVKVMLPKLAATLGARRFLREIQIAANLNHPHIVALYDSGEADGFLYYVMPYVEGESLRARLKREPQLPIDTALQVTREAAEALDYAHEVGVVHRDIKPENLLLSRGHALVADFGIAKAVSSAGGSALTSTGISIGTPLYMSPEQATGDQNLDGRADIYSLGCVLYEMLAGQAPFTGPTAESIARQHLTTEPRPVTELRPTVPDGVSAAILRALAKTPADRFRVTSLFVEALASPTVHEGTRPPRRSWFRAALLAAISISLAVLAVILIGKDVQPGQDPYRVVVVSLENRTGDTTLALLGSLAADWITQGLQEIEVIDVVPRGTGVEPGPDLAGGVGSTGVGDPRAAGEATGAGTVVAGAYYRRGDSLEFQTQVIDATGERLLRAVAPVTGPLGASGTLLDSLRRRVTATVAAVLDRRLMVSTPVSPLPSLEAYRLYLEGYRTFYDVPQRMREALGYFYRAVALDSAFTDPRFYIVFAHQNLGEWSAADSNAQLLIPFRSQFSPYQRATLDWMLALLRGDRATALRAARARRVRHDAAVEAYRFNRPYEAIELLEGVGNQSALGFNYFKWITLMEAYHVVGDHRRELAEARRARELGPDRLRMLISEVRALAALGRLDDVERRLDESLLLPSEGMIVAVDVMIIAGGELRAHGHRDASLRVAERAVQWFTAHPPTERTGSGYKFGFAQTLYLAEQWEGARALFEESAPSDAPDVNIQGFLGVLAARRGDRAEALRISGQLEGMADPYDFGRDVYWQACIASQLGELDRAMVLLREAYARGRMFSVLLHTDMDLEPLRDHPEYEAFIKPKE